MELLIVIPAFIIFIYSLFMIAKDDYILIRRNVSTEDIFDIAFLVGIGTLIFSRLIYFLLHPVIKENTLSLIFSTKGSFSLFGGFLGGIFILYLISKYRRIPLGRLFDFFIFSFIVCLPFGFLGYGLLYIKSKLIFSLINVIFDMIFWILFFKFLYPKILNRTLRDGTASLIFFILFSLTLLISKNIFPVPQLTISSFVTIENVSLAVFCLFSFILLIRQEQGRSRRR